jgi:hypothetical protein
VDQILYGEPLSDVRVIITIMRNFMVKLLCQTVMGRILVLECSLRGEPVACCQAHVGVCGYILSCLVLNGLATRGSRLWGHLPDNDNPQVWLPMARVCVESGLEKELD